MATLVALQVEGGDGANWIDGRHNLGGRKNIERMKGTTLDTMSYLTDPCTLPLLFQRYICQGARQRAIFSRRQEEGGTKCQPGKFPTFGLET